MAAPPITGCGAVALTGTGNSKTATCSTSSLAVGTHSIVADYAGDAGNAASSSAPFSQVINPAGSAAASFVATDLVTQGNWKGRYGSEGYAILNDSTSYPAYATVTPSGKADHVWAAQPDTDARALQRGVAAGRIAACWYSSSSFNVDVNLTDQATHRVTVYLLDWDASNRVTRIDVLDASTQQVLATQTAPAHTQGVHMVWDLRGHVTLRFTRLGGIECRTERHLLRPGDGSADVFGQRHGHRERRGACRRELRGPRRRELRGLRRPGQLRLHRAAGMVRHRHAIVERLQLCPDITQLQQCRRQPVGAGLLRNRRHCHDDDDADEFRHSGDGGHDRDLHRDGHRIEPDGQRQLRRRWWPADHRLRHGRADRHRQQQDRHLQHQQPGRRHPQHRRRLFRRCRQCGLEQRAVRRRSSTRPGRPPPASSPPTS